VTLCVLIMLALTAIMVRMSGFSPFISRIRNVSHPMTLCVLIGLALTAIMVRT